MCDVAELKEVELGELANISVAAPVVEATNKADDVGALCLFFSFSYLVKVSIIKSWKPMITLRKCVLLAV